MRIIMWPRVRVRILVVGTVLTLLLPMVVASPVGAATVCVAPGGAGGCFATIQAAITAATANDTITVAAGTYNERITIGKNLTITGVDATSILDGAGGGGGTTLIVSPGITASVSGLVIRNGSQSNIVNQGTLTLTNATVTGSTDGVGGQGGGINNAVGATLTLVASTVSGNTASFEGGGIFNFGTLMTVRNSTIANNIVTTSGGGGILDQGTTTTVTNSTISGNQATAGLGGGFSSASAGVTVTNTIIAENSASIGPDTQGAFISGGRNLVGKSDGGTGFTGTGDLTGTAGSPLNPMLGGLGNNGGPTQTMALLSGSPAIDTIPSGGGCGVSITTDQRGQPRPMSAGLCDIGAYEAQPTALPLSPKPAGPPLSGPAPLPIPPQPPGPPQSGPAPLPPRR